MKHSYFKIPGWFNYSETYDTIVDEVADDAKILEIGSFMGRSTHYLATALHNADKTNVKIYALDTFEGSSEHASLKIPKDFFSVFKENLKFFIGRDYIMVDGAHEHEAVMDDIENWWPKLKENGVMFGDDFYLEAVSEAVKISSGNVKSPGYSVNGSTERTWFMSKDGKHNRFERLIPGQNTLI
jgi:hypothetical protein